VEEEEEEEEERQRAPFHIFIIVQNDARIHQNANA
jgi:hypothetical protein